MKRFIALDVGSKRIGVAVSDELAMFAHPRKAVICGKKKEFQELKLLFEEFKPTHLVVGLPLEMSGKSGERVQEVQKFCERLRGYLSSNAELRKIEFVFWDERLSSIQAERALRGKSAEERKAMTDSVAAVIILESYLQSVTSVS